VTTGRETERAGTHAPAHVIRRGPLAEIVVAAGLNPATNAARNAAAGPVVNFGDFRAGIAAFLHGTPPAI
jgi:hypothetical protein